MKYSFKPILLAALITSALAAHGQNQQPRPTQVLTPGFGLPIINAQGDINTTNANLTPLIQTAMNQTFARQKEDKEFFKQSVNDIAADFKKLYDSIIVQKLMVWQGQSTTGGYVKLDVYLATVADYYGQLSALRNKIQGIQQMASGALPSATQVVVSERQKTDVPAYLNSIKLQPLVDYYNARIKTDIEGAIATYNLMVWDENAGIQRPVQGLSTQLKGFVQLSGQKRAALQAEINNLRKVPESVKSLQDRATYTMKEMAEKMITDMGVNERYRFHNADFYNARLDYFKSIAEFFNSRSYLRIRDGIPQGTIGVKWKKRYANIETFLTSPYEYWNFSRTTIRAQKDLMSVQDAYRNLYNSAKDRASSIFDGNFGILAKINSIATSVRGYGPMMESVAMVIQGLAADCAEELVLQQPNSFQKLSSMYKQRYLSTEESKKNAIALQCGYDAKRYPTLCGKTGPASSDAIIDGGVNGIIKEIMTAQNNLTYNFSIAREKESVLTMLENMNQSNVDLNNEQRNRVEDLFK